MRIRKFNEMAVNPQQKMNITRFRDSINLKNFLSDANNIIKDLKVLFNKINVNDIDIINSDDDDYSYTIKYTHEINKLLDRLVKLVKLSNNEEYLDKLYGGGYNLEYISVTIDEDRLNKIDINNGLPNFFKGIGLGKLIYKALIKKFGYISSFNGDGPSIDSSMVWDSLSKEKDLYTFVSNQNIITFNSELSYDEILDVLDDFYIDLHNSLFDDDFMNKYNLTESELKEIIKAKL